MKEATVAKFATVQNKASRLVERAIEHLHLMEALFYYHYYQLYF